MIDQNSPDRVIESLLIGLRRRARMRSGLVATLAVVAACLFALTAARLLALPDLGTVRFSSAIIAAGLIAFFISLAAIMIATRDMAPFARRADAALGLDERLSTSLEILRRPGERRDVVARALLGDTAARARTVQPGIAEPFLRSGTLAAISALIVSVLTFGLLAIPVDGTGRGGTGTQVAASDEHRGGDILDDIRQMAELVSADAALRDDGYLAAVGESLKELANLGESMSPEDILERFAELSDHAARGYGDDLPAWMPRTEQQFADIGQLMADFIDQTTQDPQRVADALRQQSQDMCASEGAAYCDDGTDWDLLSELTPDRRGAASTQLGERGQDGMATGPLMDGGEDDGEVGLELLDFETGAARPVGANTQSGRGSGDAVGDGTQDFQRSTDFRDAEMGAREQISIAAGEDESGNRIEILFLPEVAYTDVADGAVDLASQLYGWEEAVSTRNLVQMRDREVVGRFFSRHAQQ